MNKRKKGFTLIELIVCLALLLIILGAIGNLFVPVLNHYYSINTDIDYQNTLGNISSSINEQIRYLSKSEVVLSDACVEGYVCIQASDYQDWFHDSDVEFELSFTEFIGGIDKKMVIKKAGETVYTLSDSLKMMNYSGTSAVTAYPCLNYKGMN